MKVDDRMSTDEIFIELSNRFRQYRIAKSMTQADLAEQSMVSISTVKRFEKGEDVSVSNLIRMMVALGIQNKLDLLLPDQSIRPSANVDGFTPRQRARKRQTQSRGWKWGDEE